MEESLGGQVVNVLGIGSGLGRLWPVERRDRLVLLPSASEGWGNVIFFSLFTPGYPHRGGVGGIHPAEGTPPSGGTG